MAILDYVTNTPGVWIVPPGAIGNGPNFPNALWIQGNPITLDGNTTICIETFTAVIEPDFNKGVAYELYDGNEDLMTLGNITSGENSSNVTRNPTTMFTRVYLTPSAGTHTYQIRAWADTGSKVSRIYSGPTGGQGQAGYWAPAYYRVTTDQ